MASLTGNKPELPLEPFGNSTLRERRVNIAGIYVFSCLILSILSNFGHSFSIYRIYSAFNSDIDLYNQKFVRESRLKAKNST